jgi:WD40 repeat protein
MYGIYHIALNQRTARPNSLPIVLLAGLVALGRGRDVCAQMPPLPIITPDRGFAITPGSSIKSVAISPDGKIVAFAGGRGVRLFDLANERAVFNPKDQKGNMQCVVFSPDGKSFATSTAGTAVWNDPTRIWDTQTQKVVHELKPPPQQASFRLAYSPDSKMLATLETDHKVRLWDVASGRLIVALPHHAGEKKPCRVAFSPDGKMLAVSTFVENIVEVHDLSGPRPLKDLHTQKPRLTIECADKVVHEVLLTPDSRALITVSDRRVQLWDVQTGKVLKELDRAKKHEARAAALSPDGKLLAISGHNNMAELWDLSTHNLVAYLGPFSGLGTQALAFTPDGGGLIAGAMNGDAYFFKMPKKK